ncbi:hypothetical protein L9F63_006382 [Diploptera punctata]|uniref:Uncharacterized protein n=1 Tax=Diploptera punctata TaxID=6984 RepID=A0AAD8E4Z8_DIPPU|nr:hypothetical protein L9F63_006382 [Diploptera punctata]
MPSSRIIKNRTVLLWALVLIATLSCGVQAAPEPFHRRQGDPAIIMPPSEIDDFEEMASNVNIDDPKHREILFAILQMYKNEMQKQGVEDDLNGLLDNGATTALETMPNLSLPAAIQAKLFRSPDEVDKEEIKKRGSYQPSLCYFKICNMGRKRNIR